MNSFWSRERAVWYHAVLGERTSWIMGWTALAGVLAFFFLLLSPYAGMKTPMETLALSWLPIGALILFFWMRFVPGAVRQNTPAIAHLVPGLHRHVRRAVVLTWCATMLLLSPCIAGLDHHALAGLWMAVSITGISMAIGARSIGNVVYILMTIAIAVLNKRTAALDFLSTPPMLALLTAGALALAWYALVSTFPAGGERHWRLLAAQAKLGSADDLHQAIRRKRVSGARFRLYARWLARDLRPGVRPERRMMHALGPYNHRFDVVLPVVTIVVAAIVARLGFLFLDLPARQLTVALEIIMSMSVPLMMLHGLNFHRFVASIDSTSGEQALVRLAPGIPQGRQLNVSLARQLLRIAVGEWLACAITIIGLLLLFGGGARQLVLIATMMPATLATTAWALRDYARRDDTGMAGLMLQVPVMVGATLALFLLREQPFAWTVLLVLAAGAAGLIVRSRWRTLVGAAVAFPARRLS
jgi:hypothetical protein